MAVVGFRETPSRSLQQRIGEGPNAERRFVATLDSPDTSHQAVINDIGIAIGDAHPEYGFLQVTDASLSENAGSPYHVEVTFRYEVLQADFEPNPLLRPDVWSFSIGGATIPAIAYYSDADTVEPLVNAAGEIIESATTEEAEIRATIVGNRASFPLGVAAYVSNTLNNSAYLGGRAYTWKCAGIGGQQQSEMVNGQRVQYYQITSELVYRASGWPLILPDIGFNYLDGGELKRAWVVFKDDEGTEQRVPAANAVALAENGAMLPPGNPPRLLSRRVHRAVAFSTYFGTPSF